MCAANWLVRMVPKTARPMVLPMERKNCSPAVTSPRRWLGYWFCTMTVKELMAIPSPRPMSTMLRVSTAVLVSTPILESSQAPTVTVMKPMMTSTL